MVNVKKNVCSNDNCLKGACFNFPGQTKGLYCLEHKTNGMVNVVTEKCIYSS
jgi:hypothetical protein